MLSIVCNHLPLVYGITLHMALCISTTYSFLLRCMYHITASTTAIATSNPNIAPTANPTVVPVLIPPL